MSTRLGIPFLLEYQQNRHPVLLLDEVIDYKAGEFVHARKNYSYNEWFFPGHFSDAPSVPGFIQLESLAQAFILTFLTFPEHKGKQTAFSRISNAKFMKKLVPGDTLDVYAELKSFKFGVASGECIGRVGDELACSAEFTVVLPDIIEKFRPSDGRKAVRN